MPIIISTLIGALVNAMGTFVGRALVALGFGFAQYVGISALFSSLESRILALLGNMAGSGLLEWAGFLRLDVHVTLIISAIGTKILMNQLQDGKKFLVRK